MNAKTFRRVNFTCGLAIAGTFLATSASADLVTNGSFQDVTFQGTATILNYPQAGGADVYSLTYGAGFANQPGEATTLAGWTTNATFEYVAEPPAGTFNSEADYDLWPGISSQVPLTSPNGGNFIIDDATQSLTGYLSQTVNGLAVGDTYTLSFYQAAAQAYPYSGGTLQQWDVYFGGDTYQAPVMSNANHDFTPWSQVTTTFSPPAKFCRSLAKVTSTGPSPRLLFSTASRWWTRQLRTPAMGRCWAWA